MPGAADLFHRRDRTSRNPRVSPPVGRPFEALRITKWSVLRAETDPSEGDLTFFVARWPPRQSNRLAFAALERLSENPRDGTSLGVRA